MQLVKVSDVSKSFGLKKVLEKVSFTISEKDRIGLVGENGSGKSTLCKILLGKESPDNASVIISSDITVSYLPQERRGFSENCTVANYTQSFLGTLNLIKKEMEELETKIALEPSEEFFQRYGNLQEIWERKEGWNIGYRIKMVRQGMGIDHIGEERLLSSLSGGEKTRIALGALLISSPDLLILDEPTNYLDFATLKWLEEYLSNFKKALLIISHDRDFLNKAVDKIFEISSHTHQLQVFNGNYDQYLFEKEKSFEKKQKEYEEYLQEVKRLKILLKEKTFSKREPKGPSDSFKAAWDFWEGRAEKNHSSQIRAAKLKLKCLEENPVDLPLESVLKGFRFYEEPLESDIPIRIVNLSKTYGDNFILSGIDKEIFKKDKIVIVGENGSGKTTFLNLIMGLEELSTGKIEKSSSLKIGYLDQEQKSLNLEHTVLEEYSLVKKGDEGELREDLHKMGLFSSSEVFFKVKDLSLGQKQKLMFSKIIALKPNVLILDEPTNHLDLLSLEQLEKALKNFQGVIIAVSHDRRFIRKIATDVWHLKDKKLFSENKKEISKEECVLLQ